jgi:hypothetical protein
MSLPRLWLYRGQGMMRDAGGRPYHVRLEKTPDTAYEARRDPSNLGPPIRERGRRIAVLDDDRQPLFWVEAFVEAERADAPEVGELERQVESETRRRLVEQDWEAGEGYGLVE